MTSKTFKSAMTDNRELEVDVIFRKPRILIKEFDGDNTGFVFAPSDAPALALAILEAAGYEERQKSWDVLNSADENFAQAMRCLSKGLELQERATAEVRERAALEAEAVELFNANHGTNRTDWDHADRSVISSWVRVARRARELAKEATK